MVFYFYWNFFYVFNGEFVVNNVFVNVRFRFVVVDWFVVWVIYWVIIFISVIDVYFVFGFRFFFWCVLCLGNFKDCFGDIMMVVEVC